MNHPLHQLLAGLYAITNASVTDPEITIRYVEQALAGGARIIQFRDKSSDPNQLLSTANAIRKLTKKSEALFIVNDDVDLAKKVNANGVHLGQRDIGLTEARKQLGDNYLIGISCYNQFKLAEQAANEGANYVAFGSFFPSRTKPDAAKADIELIHRAKQELTVPVVAIGGITLENAPSLIGAGADMLAVVEGIFGQADIEAAAREFCLLFNSE